MAAQLPSSRSASSEREPGFGGVGEEGQARVCGEVHAVVAQAELANDGMVEVLDAGVVEADVVGRPEGAERLALGCEFADEV